MMGLNKREYTDLQNEQGVLNPIIFNTTYAHTRFNVRELVQQLVQNDHRILEANSYMLKKYGLGKKNYPYNLGGRKHPTYYSHRLGKWVIFHRLKFVEELE